MSAVPVNIMLHKPPDWEVPVIMLHKPELNQKESTLCHRWLTIIISCRIPKSE
jgi:hypothetical protein